jgi:hypothetical protein
MSAFVTPIQAISFTTMIVAVGYEISSDTFDEFLSENDMLESGFPDYQKFLNHLESQTSTMVHLAHLDDESEGTTIRHTFVCCYVDYRDRIYDCEEIMAIDVPSGFTHIRDIIQTKGVLRCIMARKGILFSYDSNGNDRVQEDGLVV